MSENMRTCVTALSDEIETLLGQLTSEERFPAHSPDDSEDLIKRLTKGIAKLRALREEIENVFTGRL
jgi:hypothetical protein